MLVGMRPALIPQSGAAADPVVSTFITSTSSGSDIATYTFAATSIGAAAADRFVVVGFVIRAATARSITGVTIGGNAAAMLAESDTGSATMHAVLYGLAVPAGTTATIEVTLSGAGNRCGLGVWTITGLSSITPVDTLAPAAADPITGGIDVSAGGCIIGIATTLSNTTTVWTGITEDYDAGIEASQSHSGAHDNFVGAETNRTITADFNTAGTNQRMAVVSMR